MKKQRYLLAILAWLLPREDREAVLGDLNETEQSNGTREYLNVAGYVIRKRLTTALTHHHERSGLLAILALVSATGGLYIRSSQGFRNPTGVSLAACFVVLLAALIVLRRMNLPRLRDRFPRKTIFFARRAG